MVELTSRAALPGVASGASPDSGAGAGVAHPGVLSLSRDDSASSRHADSSSLPGLAVESGKTVDADTAGGSSSVGSRVAFPAASSECAIWGVLNVTPDSFSDGGAYLDYEAALTRARQMVVQGAAVVDVGGESTRPKGKTYGEGALAVSAEEEARRVLPIVEALVRLGVRVSLDTTKAEVAQQACRAGAELINDVSCGRSAALLRAAAEAEVELVLMHNRGQGERTGTNVAYDDVVQDVKAELLAAVERAVAAGVRRERIWLDPGSALPRRRASRWR